MLIQFVVNGVIIGATYALVGLGFALVYNTTRIFHMAYGAVYVASAYAFFCFYRVFKLPFLSAFLFAIVVAALLNVLVEVLIYKPACAKGSPPVMSLISSLGLYIVIVNVIALVFGNETKDVFPGIQNTFHLGNVVVTGIQLVQLVVFLFAFLLYLFFLRKTGFGRLVRALSDNAQLLSSFGVEVAKLRVLIFALSGVFAGLASCLVATDVGIDPHVGMPILLIGIVSFIVGGVGRFESAIAGGIMIGILQNLVVWRFSSRWQESIVFFLLIIFLLFRPQGIWGEKKRLEE